MRAQSLIAQTIALELQIDAVTENEKKLLTKVEEKLSNNIARPKRKKSLERLLFDATLARDAIRIKTQRKITILKTRSGI